MTSASRRSVIMGGASLAASVLTHSRSGQATPAIRTWNQYAPGGWGQIHLRLAEPASGPELKTPLACFHQTPTSGGYYAEFQAIMAADRLVISPDTPGYGGSTPPPAQPDMEDYGAAMVEAFNSLGYGEGGDKGPIDVLGFHTGNFVILEMARQQPSLIRKMVMPGIPYYPEEDREIMREQYGLPRPLFTDPNYIPDYFKAAVTDRESNLSGARLLELFTERLRAGAKSHYGFDAVFRYHPDPVLTAITHPVFLPILNESLADQTRVAGTMIANAEVREMMQLDGRVWFDSPERLAEPVRRFLDQA